MRRDPFNEIKAEVMMWLGSVHPSQKIMYCLEESIHRGRILRGITLDQIYSSPTRYSVKTYQDSYKIIKFITIAIIEYIILNTLNTPSPRILV